MPRLPRVAPMLQCLLGVLLHTTALGAQSLQGTVVDSALRKPVPGSIVMVLDAAGNSLARTLTNQRGQYRVTLPNHAARVRVLHVGFRPGGAAIPPTANGVARLDVSLALLSTVLEAVDVRDNTNCAVRRDRGQALALWEQARQGLLAMIVAREAIPSRLKRLRFQRVLEGTGDRILSQDVQVDSTTGESRPFQAARSARDFVQLGFVEDSSGVRSYFAPDADVMLEDAFFYGYCFRVMPADKSHPGLVGVGFSAAKHRAPNVDIDGAFWMDTSARVLTRIEFRYVGLDPRLELHRPGGRVEFREMSNGIVLIDRWVLRLVATRLDTVYVVRDPSMRRNRDVVPEERARFEVNESGGELATARWEDGTAWQASLGMVRIDARTHTGAPATGTDISLEHTDYRGVVDTTGQLVFRDLLPGPYRTIVHDTVLAPIDITLKTPIAFSAVRDSVHTATLDVPTAYDYARSLCPPERLPSLRPIAFFAYVTMPDGRPAAGLEIKELVKRPLDVPEWKSTAFGGKTDKGGRYFSCWRYRAG
ncbi:MAG: carboxypeptidase regulatory-like domain-containing protein [Gemmatimonadaceae bacterium]|nr:carboxypeptidase regulatory-like domain-containing protein [Gemmatimonadaceae bacterium]